jgi:hypothetical protein
VLADVTAALELAVVVDEQLRVPPQRGKDGGQRRVALPQGWLDSCDLAAGADLSAAEVGVSGG